MNDVTRVPPCVRLTDDAGESCFTCADYTGCGVEMGILVEKHSGHPLDMMEITCDVWSCHESLR